MYGTFKMNHDKLLHEILGVVAYLVWFILPGMDSNVKCAIIVILTVELVQIEARLQQFTELPKALVKKDMWLDLLAGIGGIGIMIIMVWLIKLF